MNYKILVCDDDVDIVSALEIYLKQDGHDVIKASNGVEALNKILDEAVHLVILDVMMPEMDGITAAVKIRESSNVPIIFLSAKGEDADRIFGLNMGADDYVTKPFNPVELLARVKAQLRRYANLGGIQTNDEELPVNVFQTGGLILDDNRKMVTVDGEEVYLTGIEYKILKFLMQKIDYVITPNQIYENVWNEPAFEVGKVISVHIRNIREKIEINPREPRFLKVVYGLGYKVVKIK